MNKEIFRAKKTYEKKVAQGIPKGERAQRKMQVQQRSGSDAWLPSEGTLKRIAGSGTKKGGFSKGDHDIHYSGGSRTRSSRKKFERGTFRRLNCASKERELAASKEKVPGKEGEPALADRQGEDSFRRSFTRKAAVKRMPH